MSQFKYTLPSGAKFTLEAPEGTTQDQADYTFYSQVAAGALVGFVPGQSVTGTSSSLAKFELSRLDRGTASIDNTVILAINAGIDNAIIASIINAGVDNAIITSIIDAGIENSVINSIINNLPTVNTTTGGIPSLVNIPLTNPITQADIAVMAGTGFTAPAIGPLTGDQTLALMAQVVNTVDQPANTITNNTGVGQYGLSSQQLEMAGYIKPGKWEQFIQNGPSTLVEVLNVTGVWTGLNGIYSLEDFLNMPPAQNGAQATLMENGYNSLQALGIIKTPAAQSVAAVVGTVYIGDNQTLTNATTTITNSVNSQVAALVTNSSQYGTGLTAQWASNILPVSTATSNEIKIQASTSSAPTSGSSSSRSPTTNSLLATGLGALGLGALTSGITPNLAGVKTAMDTLGKASQYASTAASTLSSGLDKISALTVDGVVGQLQGSATALAGQIQGQITGQATALVNQVKGQATALANQLQGQANALIASAQAQANALIAQGDSLVSSVQKAAGFANTVNRASIDTAFTKILGDSKISVPKFSVNLPSSASIGAALDINKAQGVLQGLQSQATGLASQVTGLANQATGLANQATGIAGQVQGSANTLLAQAKNTIPRIG
jgi:hypothetical protein